VRGWMLQLLTSVALLSAALVGPGSGTSGCQFVLGFATFSSLIPQVVGQCLDDEQHDPTSGDAVQQTSNGLLVWRKTDNFTAFTDGFHTRVAGPYGIEQRLNSQRFVWEANPQQLPLAPENAALSVANRLAWNGAQVRLQAGTSLTLALPAPTSADLGSLPTATAGGLPAPAVALLPDGDAALTLTVPPGASGSYALNVSWPDGQQGSLQLVIGATVTRAGNLGSPDDLIVAPDGSVLYTDLAGNTVGQILADGTRRTLISGLNVPEGLAVTGADTLVLADQGTDRVLQWTASGGLRSLWQLTPVPGVDGIDGLSTAVIAGRLTALLPDSANGRLLLLQLDTLAATAFPGSWQRPTDAVVSGGQVYLVAEYGSRLWRGPLQGPLQPVGPAMTYPDDVVVDAGGVAYVNTLGQGATGGSIERIDAAGQGSAVLTGLNDPQGLDLDGAGNLVLAEGGAGRIAVDVRSCLPLMLGGAGVTLKVGGPAQAISLGTDCVAGQPSFSLAPGARWPAPPGTVWPAGNLTTLTLDNGARAALESVSGAALLLLQPPAQGSSGTATVAVQMHLGQQVVSEQVLVTVAP